MVFKNGVKNIQTAGYNGARTVIPYLFVNVFKTYFSDFEGQKYLKILEITVTVPGWINDDIWRGACINHRSQFPTKLLNGRNDLSCIRRHFLPSDHLDICDKNSDQKNIWLKSSL